MSDSTSDSRELETTEHDAALTLRIPPPESTGANEEEPEVAWSPKRGGGLLILLAGTLFLVLNFFDVYPIEMKAEEASWRENGYAIVLVSAGLVLSFFGRNKIAAGASILVGVVMIVIAVLVGYPLTLRMIDFGAGVAAIVGGVMCLPGASDD